MLSPSDMVAGDKEGEGREWLDGCVQGLAWGATLNLTLFQGFRKRFPNNPTTAHPMPICKSKANPNNYLPEISVILTTLLLLPTTLRECLPFVHLGNLFWSSRIIRVLIIPDPNEPREPERDAAFVHLMAEKISKARKSAVEYVPLLAPQCISGLNSNRPSGPPTPPSAQTRYQAWLHPR
jgi:hypothetical protein